MSNIQHFLIQHWGTDTENKLCVSTYVYDNYEDALEDYEIFSQKIVNIYLPKSSSKQIQYISGSVEHIIRQLDMLDASKLHEVCKISITEPQHLNRVCKETKTAGVSWYEYAGVTLLPCFPNPDKTSKCIGLITHTYP